MDTLEAVNWMKEQGIFEIASSHSSILKKIYTECLNVTSEKVLIIGDTGLQQKAVAPILAGAYYLAAQELNIESKLVFQEVRNRSQDASQEVQDSLKDIQPNSVVILALSDKLGNTPYPSFREFCKKRNHRFISALGLMDIPTSHVQDLIEPIDVNYRTLQSQLQKAKEMLDDAEELTITTKNGTNLSYNIKGCTALLSDGNYLQPGNGGNLPAGEIFIPPNGKRVEGKIVVDGSSRNHRGTSLIEKHIHLAVEDGSITKVEGAEEAKKLEQAFNWAATLAKNPGAIKRIASFGIGMNPKARLIGSAIVDEKVCNTAHIGIGSNHWFGGSIYALTHFGQTFKEPVIKVDGKKITLP